MRELAEVESAKALMTEARDWSVMRWLREKKRVRKAADLANAALDRLNEQTKARWSAGLKAVYDEVRRDGKPGHHKAEKESSAADSEFRLFAMRVKEADEEAYRAHLDAEDTFDEAERKLSTSKARDGCRKAIASWDLHEKAIRKAEAGIK